MVGSTGALYCLFVLHRWMTAVVTIGSPSSGQRSRWRWLWLSLMWVMRENQGLSKGLIRRGCVGMGDIGDMSGTVREAPQRKMKPRSISKQADRRYEPYGRRGSTLTVETRHRVVTRVVHTLEVDRIIRMGSETVSPAAHMEQQRDQPLNLVIPVVDAQEENCSPLKYLATARWVLSLMHRWLQHPLLFRW